MILNENLEDRLSKMLLESEVPDCDTIKKDIKSKKATSSTIRSFIAKIYRQKPEQLIDVIPSVGELIRMSITIGIPTMINPFFGLFTMIVDKAIKDKVNSRYIGLYISNYQKQLNHIEGKIDNCTDSKQKENLMKVKKDLENSIEKLETIQYDYDDAKDPKNGIIGKMIHHDECYTNYVIFMQECVIAQQYDPEYLNDLNESVKMDIKTAKHDADRKVDKMDKWFDDALKSIRDGANDEDRERLIQGKTNIKLSTIIKKAVLIGATWAINPAIAAIGLTTSIVLKKANKEKQRLKLLRELKAELEIVDEKIKDADNDRQKKYQLMRLKQKLQTDIDRLRSFI